LELIIFTIRKDTFLNFSFLGYGENILFDTKQCLSKPEALSSLKKSQFFQIFKKL
tara:strand:- start:758 stop:922 length:165 start_codon:yes stop_codon:yes gene_type:complete